MKFKQLEHIFLDHADDLRRDVKSKTARYRATSYVKAAGLMAKVADQTITQKLIDELPLTSYMKERAAEIWKNPKLFESRNDLYKQLSSIMGIGPVKAAQLIEQGLTKIEDLPKYIKNLSDETNLFLKLKPLVKIPRVLITKLEKIIKQAVKDINITDTYIVGSYRRGLLESSDIDVLLVSEDDHILDKFYQSFNTLIQKKKGSIHIYSKGPDRTSAILKLGPAVKFDFFRSPPESAAAMLLYSTGSKEHNILMRQKAKKLGYLLNQDGLFKDGKKIPLMTEKAYFDILKMPYKEPSDRI